MTLAALPRYWRTIQHLRWSQIGMRLRRAARGQLVRWGWPTPIAHPHPTFDRGGIDIDFPEPPLPHAEEVAGEPFIARLRRGEFHHLHETNRVGYASPDWSLGGRTDARLWRITLHYHAWVYELARLVAAGGPLAGEAARLLEHYLSHWLRAGDGPNGPGGDLIWNSYAIATRLTWWIRANRQLARPFFADRRALHEQYLGSLFHQARHLAGNIEWDLRGNHLLRDAVGLAWAGRFFPGPEAAGWLQLAQRLGVDQVREQVLPDGGHFERSPHYHAEVMHDCLSLALLLPDAAARAELRASWERMAEYLAWSRHPDGLSPQFNDGGRCCPAESLSHSACLGASRPELACRGGRWFTDTGLVAWHGTPWTVFLDVGEIGPSYQPGHAHADTLTVECSHGSRRLFIDPGTYGYDADERRRYERSTRAHNTVMVDDTDSSEVWHIFRVGRRARPSRVEYVAQPAVLRAAATHDGFAHLTGSPRHRRTLDVRDNGPLWIVDEVTGAGTHRVEGGFLLGPDWHAEMEPNGWALSASGERLRVVAESSAPLQLGLEQRPYFPDYGREATTTRLVWRYLGSLPLRVAITVLRESAAPVVPSLWM